MPKVDKLEKQQCPMCGAKTLTLTEEETEVPYFGKIFLFSMSCSGCKYRKADIEAEEQKEPSRFTIEVDSEKDMAIRVVKSSFATVKIPHITTITPGPASQGYVTNIEGLIERVKEVIQMARSEADEKSDMKKAKNMLKKLQKVVWGREKLKIIIEDPSGNSAIISDKAEKTKLK